MEPVQILEVLVIAAADYRIHTPLACKTDHLAVTFPPA